MEKIRLGALFSSGKDSTYAMHIMHEKGYEIACLVAIESENVDSWMFHTPAIDTTEYQAEALGIPLMMFKTKGEKELELDDLKNALVKAKERYDIKGITTGALYSDYQRHRIENICKEIGLEVFSPLWHMNQEVEMRDLVDKGFKFIFTRVAAEGLDKGWLGKIIVADDIDRLVELNKSISLNIAGEGGEFESLVLDAPMFKQRLRITDYKIVEESGNRAELVINMVELEEKDG